MERVTTIENAKLYKLLEEKAKALKEGKEQYKRKEEEEQKLHKCGMKIQKYKDKIIPLVRELTKDLVGEFEDLTQVDIKDGKIQLTIVDKVEEFKQAFLKAKYEQGTTQTDAKGESGEGKK